MSLSVPRYAGVGHYKYYQARLVVGDAGHSTGSEEKTGREYHNISVRTLDEVLKDSLHPVTFVKCDVEGHELAVLLGSRTVLDRWSPAWLVEVAGSPEAEGSSAAALFDLMRKAGYESWIFSDGRLRRRVPGDKWLNYFFLKEDHPYLLPHLFLPRQTVIRPGGGDLRDSKLLRVMGRISQYSNPVPLASPALTLRPSIDAKIVRRGGCPQSPSPRRSAVRRRCSTLPTGDW